MLHVHSDPAPLHRDGVSRRAVLRAGLLGVAGLSGRPPLVVPRAAL